MDSDFQADIEEIKSTSAYSFTLSTRAISWRSVKQSYIDGSSMEGEYVAASEASKEAIWLHKFLGMVPNIDRPVVLFFGNSTNVSQCKKPRNHKKKKHIERKYHLIRDLSRYGR